MHIQSEGTTHTDGMGGQITIIDAGDELRPMRFRMVLPKGFGPPAPECHPSQREDFVVIRGVLDLGEVGGKRVVLSAGDRYSLPSGTYHLPRNGGDSDLEFEATLTPGKESASMFAALYAATREHRGVGRFARVAMVFRQHRSAITFPFPVRTAMAIVAWFGQRVGLGRHRSTPIPRDV